MDPFHDQDSQSLYPEQKAEIVRRHLAGKEQVSNLADEFHLQPTQIHA
jgi:transposase-like protein